MWPGCNQGHTATYQQQVCEVCELPEDGPPSRSVPNSSYYNVSMLGIRMNRKHDRMMALRSSA